MKRFQLFLSMLVTLLFVQCSAWNATAPVVRTIYDAAVALCSVSPFAQVQAQKDGMTVRDWCQIAKNLQPFVDAVLSAQAQAEKASMSKQGTMKCEPPAAPIADGGAD